MTHNIYLYILVCAGVSFAIRELPLTLECKVIYSQRQERNAIGQEVLDRYYAPTEADPEGDIHTA